jgi:pyrimidine-nucleoside phosphorylase
MLVVGKRCKNRQEARPLLERALADGSAFEVFRRLVKAQGGDVRTIDDPSRLPQSKTQLVVYAPKAGFITAIDALALGKLAIELGAGRTRADQKIDPAAGFELHVIRGDRVARGAPLVTIHAKTGPLAKSVQKRVTQAFSSGPRPPTARPLVLQRLH